MVSLEERDGLSLPEKRRVAPRETASRFLNVFMTDHEL